MNEVDTSTETINAEFEAAEQAIGIEPEAAQPTIDPMAEAEQQAQIAMAQQMIDTTLRLSIGMFANVSISKQQTDEASHAYAVLIIKYFPGGIFGLLDRYKEELGAATATFMLVKAVSQARDQQAKEEAEEKQKEADAKKPASSGTGPFMFSEESEKPTGAFTNG